MRTESQTPKTDEIVQQALRDIEDVHHILNGCNEVLNEIRHDTSVAVDQTAHVEFLAVSIQNIETYFLQEHMFAPSVVATSTAVEQLGMAINAVSHLANTVSVMRHLGEHELEVSLNYIRIGVEAYKASQMIDYLTGLINVEAGRLQETN